MQKIKNIYFETEVPAIQELSRFASGLIIELEDGSRYAHCTTDPLVSWKKL